MITLKLKKVAKAVCTLSLSVAMLSPMAHAGGIPTFDGANIAQAVAQVQNQIKQIENMRNQLQAVTGNARLGVLLNDPLVAKELAKYTPKGVNLKDLADGRYDSTLQGIAKRIEAEMKQGNKNQDPKVAVAKAQVMNLAQLEDSMNYLNSLSQQSQRISSQINMTTDAGSKADLANTLSANASQIQIAIAQTNIKMKQMEMLEKQAEKSMMDSIRKKQNR